MTKRNVLFLGCLLLSVFLCMGCSSTEKGITINKVTLAKNLDSNYQPIDPTTQFGPTDTIYVSVEIKGRPQTGTINGKFYYEDQFISEATVDLSSVNKDVLVSIGENTYAGFSLTPSTTWPIDSGYSFKLYVDDVEFGSYNYEIIQ